MSSTNERRCGNHCGHDPKFFYSDLHPDAPKEERSVIRCWHEDDDGYCGHVCEVPAEAKRHHKNCAIWTVTTDGKFKACDCAGVPAPPPQSTPPTREQRPTPEQSLVAAAKVWAKAINVRESDNEPGESEVAATVALYEAVMRLHEHEIKVAAPDPVAASDAEKFAEAIVDDLFGNAERLILSDAGEDKGRSGWARLVVKDRIVDTLRSWYKERQGK